MHELAIVHARTMFTIETRPGLGPRQRICVTAKWGVPRCRVARHANLVSRI
jgi:hypothetical protein